MSCIRKDQDKEAIEIDPDKQKGPDSMSRPFVSSANDAALCVVTAASWTWSATTTTRTTTAATAIVRSSRRSCTTGGCSSSHRDTIGPIEVRLVAFFDLRGILVLVKVAALDKDGALV